MSTQQLNLVLPAARAEPKTPRPPRPAADDPSARTCLHCGRRFIPLTHFRGTPVSTCCSDECVDKEKARRGLDCHGNPRRTGTRAGGWKAVCPPRYAAFNPRLLPQASHAIADAVLAYDPRRTPGQGVAIVGASDSGKSMLIHEAAHRAFKLGYDVFVTCAAEFGWKVADFGLRQDFINRCLHCALLVFDDVGKSRLTDRVEADFFHLLDHRERWRLPIIWSANSKGEDLRPTMTNDRADPILNRLRRSAKVFTV